MPDLLPALSVRRTIPPQALAEWSKEWSGFDIDVAKRPSGSRGAEPASVTPGCDGERSPKDVEVQIAATVSYRVMSIALDPIQTLLGRQHSQCAVQQP
jgi:hypothetical protein